MNRPALQRADSSELSCSREDTDVFVDQASLGSSAVRGPSRSVEPTARTGSVDRELTHNPHRLNQFRCQAVSVQRRQPKVSTGGPSRRVSWLRAVSGRTYGRRPPLGRRRVPPPQRQVRPTQSHHAPPREPRMPLCDRRSSGLRPAPTLARIRLRLADDHRPADALRTRAGHARRMMRPTARWLYGSAGRDSPTSPSMIRS